MLRQEKLIVRTSSRVMLLQVSLHEELERRAFNITNPVPEAFECPASDWPKNISLFKR